MLLEHYLAPNVPSPYSVVCKALELAEIRAGKDVVYDAGCNDGIVPITAIKSFNARHAVGIEFSERLAKNALNNVIKSDLQEKVEIINDDVFNCSFRKADIVYLYLTTDSNEKIRTKLESELKPSARVVSHACLMERWKPFKEVRTEPGEYEGKYYYSHPIYLYRMNEIY